MISLRLSETEYEMVKKHYRNFGARNVSDLARLALQRIMAVSGAYEETFTAALEELKSRIHALESQRRMSRGGSIANRSNDPSETS